MQAAGIEGLRRVMERRSHLHLLGSCTHLSGSQLQGVAAIAQTAREPVEGLVPQRSLDDLEVARCHRPAHRSRELRGAAKRTAERELAGSRQGQHVGHGRAAQGGITEDLAGIAGLPLRERHGPAESCTQALPRGGSIVDPDVVGRGGQRARERIDLLAGNAEMLQGQPARDPRMIQASGRKTREFQLAARQELDRNRAGAPAHRGKQVVQVAGLQADSHFMAQRAREIGSRRRQNHGRPAEIQHAGSRIVAGADLAVDGRAVPGGTDRQAGAQLFFVPAAERSLDADFARGQRVPGDRLAAVEGHRAAGVDAGNAAGDRKAIEIAQGAVAEELSTEGLERDAAQTELTAPQRRLRNAAAHVGALERAQIAAGHPRAGDFDSAGRRGERSVQAAIAQPHPRIAIVHIPGANAAGRREAAAALPDRFAGSLHRAALQAVEAQDADRIGHRHARLVAEPPGGGVQVFHRAGQRKLRIAGGQFCGIDTDPVPLDRHRKVDAEGHRRVPGPSKLERLHGKIAAVARSARFVRQPRVQVAAAGIEGRLAAVLHLENAVPHVEPADRQIHYRLEGIGAASFDLWVRVCSCGLRGRRSGRCGDRRSPAIRCRYRAAERKAP